MSIEAMKNHKCPHCEREFVCNHHEWVGLTDEEKQTILDRNIHSEGRFGSYTTTLGIVNDTEAKLREKNAYGWQSVENPTEYLDDLRGGDAT